jgi:DNA-binding response OmpR family regulator
MQASILVIEDEPDLRSGLQHNLELDGFRVAVAANGTDGLRLAVERDFSLVLLDLMLPGKGGLEVLRGIRDAGRATPVIILSARGQDQDKVQGLEYGADDYVTKPFALTELTARIRAVLRRYTDVASRVQDVYDFPELRVDFKRFTVTRGGREHQLSRYEAEILRMLIAHRGQVVTRRDLLTKVWGYVHLPTTRTVDNHIARLRKKIEVDVENPKHVVTVHGIGYRFDGTGASQ